MVDSVAADGGTGDQHDVGVVPDVADALVVNGDVLAPEAGPAPSPPWNGIPLATLPVPACAQPPPVGVWHRRGCGPPEVVGLIVDPTNDRRQYAYTLTRGEINGLIQIAAGTTDGWATWRSHLAAGEEVTSYSFPTFAPTAGGLFILDETGLLVWSPGARRRYHPTAGGFTIAGAQTAKPTIIITPRTTNAQSTAIETTTDDGASWTRHEVPAAEPLAGLRDYRMFHLIGDPNDALGLWIFDVVKHKPENPRNDHYVQHLVRSTDGGATWKTCRPFDGPDMRFVVGGGSVIYASPPGSDPLEGVPTIPLPPAPLTLRSDDGCTKWVPLTKSCRVLAADPGSSHVYCVEYRTGILWQSRDRGDTWRQVDGSNAATTGLHVSPKSQGRTAILWGEAGILETRDDGASWKRLSSGGPMPTGTRTYDGMVAVDGELYVPSQGGDQLRTVLLRSQDRGESWAAVPRELSAMRSAPRIMLHEVVVTADGRWRPFDHWVEFLADPKVGLGYTSSTVISDFGATSTSFITSVFEETAPSVVVAAPNSKTVYAMTSSEQVGGAKLVVSRDAGATWTVVDHGLCGLGDVIAADRDAPDRVYVSTSDCESGALYRVQAGGGGSTRLGFGMRPYGHSPVGLVMTVGGRVSAMLGEGNTSDNLRFVLAISRDGGTTWTPETAPDNRFFQSFEDLYPLASDPAVPDVLHAGAYSLVLPPR